jgi:hypothetical protein
VLVTKFRVDAARSRAAEARRYVEQARSQIAKLRASGSEVSAAERQLASILPLIRQFEEHVQSMEDALGRQAPGGSAAGRPPLTPSRWRSGGQAPGAA